ncbi:MAG TPA: DNA-binding protein [Cytophagales bacterium]|nr:DNA-binding protein [Cytophagales bacterium]HAA17753.1 DNA-binding protein [Cytophagales bacterium]
MKKKIGVLGSGMVGKVLATGFLAKGYEVMVGTRSAEKLAEWKGKNPDGQVGTFAETASFGEILVLAVKGHIAEAVLDLAGLSNLSGKLVLDATNPIDDSRGPDGGVLRFFTTLEDSLMEQLQNKAPEAKFVKAWSSVGSAFMVDPDFGGITPTMFIAGNDAEAKTTATTILAEMGWETEDMGDAKGARAIEPLCILWCIPGMQRNQWNHAFKLLKK